MFTLRLLLSLSLVAGYQSVQAIGSETMPTVNTTMPTVAAVTTGAVFAALEAQNSTQPAVKTPTSPATPSYCSLPFPYNFSPNSYFFVRSQK
jgi:hypothetical protein